MTANSGRDPREVYRQRMAVRGAEAARHQRRHVLLGYLRLALAAASALAVWFSFHRHAISHWWLFAIVVGFVIVARRHSAVLQRKAEAQRALRFFERGLARIEDRWAELPVRHAEVNATGSLFADDLDLFRRGGLFDLLDTSRTSAGSNALASWLLRPADRDVVLARQSAITELRALTGLREELASCGQAEFETLDVSHVADWANAPASSIPAWLRWLAPLLAALTIAAAGWSLVTGNGWVLLLLVIIDATITFALKRRAEALFLRVEHMSRSLRLASVLIESWEQQTFSSPLLQELQSAFRAQDRSASEALAKLAVLTGMIEQRGNLLMKILDTPLMYSVQLAGATQAWRRQHRAALEAWLRALGELEALTSLASYSFEHPRDPFPEVCDGAARFEARELGHPLLADANCVRNDVALGDETRLLLVSGSNMSGKSTLLRAVGINTVLAMAGAPVRAASLRISPLHVGASIQVNDSLREGRSRFYSEILRLRAICALAEQRTVLFLLDELLDGTNSSDRLTGAKGIAHALLASGAIGLISTHDLTLTEIGTQEGALRNVHFEERIEAGEMHFDFKLRDGVVTTRNGLALMRMIGLKV
jgi:hypothetical protein